MEKSSSFLSYLGLDKHLPEMDVYSLQQRIVKKTIKKGTELQNPGDSVKSTYFVKSGLLRSFIVDEKGKEHIYMFAPENWIISDIESFEQGNGSTLFIDAIEDTEIEVVSQEVRKTIDEMMKGGDPNFFPVESKRLFRRIGVLQKRILLLLSATALERYDEFVKKYPNIIQRVPQKMIASYLGVTPEALSKIKSQHIRNK